MKDSQTTSLLVSSTTSFYSSKIALLLAALLVCHALPANGVIYLVHNSSNAVGWTGDCSDARCQAEATPCTYELESITTSGNCEIYWQPTLEGPSLQLAPNADQPNPVVFVGVLPAPIVPNPTLEAVIITDASNVTICGVPNLAEPSWKSRLGKLNLSISQGVIPTFLIQDIYFAPPLGAEEAITINIVDQGTSTTEGPHLTLQSITFEGPQASSSTPTPGFAHPSSPSSPSSSPPSLLPIITTSLIKYPFGPVIIEDADVNNAQFLCKNVSRLTLTGGTYRISEGVVASPVVEGITVQTGAEFYPAPSQSHPSGWSICRDSTLSVLDIHITGTTMKGMDQKAENGEAIFTITSASISDSNITFHGKSVSINRVSVLGDASHVSFGEVYSLVQLDNFNVYSQQPVSFLASLNVNYSASVNFPSIELAPGSAVSIDELRLSGSSPRAISIISSNDALPSSSYPTLKPYSQAGSLWSLYPTEIDRVILDWSSLGTLMYRLLPNRSAELTCKTSSSTSGAPSTTGNSPSASLRSCFSSLPSTIGFMDTTRTIGAPERLTTVEPSGVEGRNESNLNAASSPPSPLHVFLQEPSGRAAVELMIGNASWVPPPSPSCPAPFVCSGPNATTPGDVNVTSLIIPSTIHIIYINGSLTVTGTLTFSGASTTIIVPGCANISAIEIDLTTITQSSVKNRTVILVSQLGENCSSLANTSFSSIDHPKSCQRKSASLISSNPNQITVLFSFSNDKCDDNTKWIILGAVLGSIVLISIVGLTLLFTFNKKARTCIRPYSEHRKPVAASNIK